MALLTLHIFRFLRGFLLCGDTLEAAHVAEGELHTQGKKDLMASNSESFQKGKMHWAILLLQLWFFSQVRETAYMFSAFSGFLPNLFSILSRNKFFHKREKDSSNSLGNHWENKPSQEFWVFGGATSI